VELNRAVAVAMAFGPATGLELVDALTSEPSLRGYHLLPAVRGDLLAKLGRFDEAQRSSCARQRSRTTHASARCSSSAPPRAPTDRRPRRCGDDSGASRAKSWRRTL